MSRQSHPSIIKSRKWEAWSQKLKTILSSLGPQQSKISCKKKLQRLLQPSRKLGLNSGCLLEISSRQQSTLDFLAKFLTTTFRFSRLNRRASKNWWTLLFLSWGKFTNTMLQVFLSWTMRQWLKATAFSKSNKAKGLLSVSCNSPFQAKSWLLVDSLQSRRLRWLLSSRGTSQPKLLWLLEMVLMMWAW